MYQALVSSMNVQSVQIMRQTGTEITWEVLSQMGLEKDRLQGTGLALALGATGATPLQMATAYATFVNGGHRIQPYIIDRIYNFDNDTIYQSNPLRACASCFNKEIGKLNTDLLNDFTKNQANSDLQTDSDSKTTDEGQSDNNAKKPNAQDKKSTDKPKDTPIKDKGKDKEKSDTVDMFDASAKYDRLNPKQAIQYSVAKQAPRILSAKTAYQMATMLRGVVTSGTGRAANFRSDVGGKTGTTNLAKDVWFAGVHPTNSAVVWMGYDRPDSLGANAFGGKLALPIWKSYMSAELSDKPKQWVSEKNVADSKKATQEIIDITDDNANDINKVLQALELDGLDTSANDDIADLDGMEEVSQETDEADTETEGAETP